MMPDPGKFLLIDDDPEFRELLSARLKKLYPGTTIDEFDPVVEGGFPPEAKCTGYKVIFLDHDLRGEATGLTWYKSCHKRENFPATIMITSLGNPTTAIHAMNSGVHYYMTKQGLNEETLEVALKSAMDTHESRSQVAAGCR